MSTELVLSVVGMVTGIGALGVSFWAARSTAKQSHYSNSVQERLLSLESRREHRQLQERAIAKVRVEFRPKGGRRFPQIVVCNDGPSPIHNVAMTLDGVPIADSEETIGNTDPIKTLAPGGEFGYDFYMTGMTKMGQRLVKVTWELPDGSSDSLETTIQP